MASDPVVEDLLSKHPLVVFSLYTQVQAEAVRELGDEILEILGSMKLADAALESGGFQRAYNLFWFWVLGAHEILRTMDDPEHRSCFSTALQPKITALKRKIKVVRVPFAKQQLQNNKGPIYSELSVTGFGSDFETLVFEIEGKQHDAAELICEVRAFFAAIRREDIVATMPVRNPL